MRTIPLHGKRARGRVVLVDDGDYGLVMQYRWYVVEPPVKPGNRPKGPYAATTIWENGRSRHPHMHCLIMGFTGVDHIDHNGLNNQRSNLRIATGSQNNQNQRPQQGCTSQYKGVCYVRQNGWWRAYIGRYGRRCWQEDFASELEAAYAYDAKARELFGEFAYPNFPDSPTRAMRDQWQAEAKVKHAAAMAAGIQRANVGRVNWWAQRQPETYICAVCGAEYQSRTTARTFYCGQKCQSRAAELRRQQRNRERRDREREGRLF